MTGAMHGVTAETGGHVPADAVIATARERNTGHLVLGTPDQDVGPKGRELGFTVSFRDRVVFEESLVPDHNVMIVPLEADLPKRRVPRKEGCIAAASDECLNRVPHPARPVLVMTDGQIQARVLEHLGVFF